MTPLLLATAEGHLDCVKFLCTKVNSVQTSLPSGMNVLIAALYRDSPIVAEYILKTIPNYLQINQQLSDLEGQKNQIAGLIRDKKDYKGAIANLERQKNQYLADIDALKKEVGILTESNTQLTGQNQQLNASLTETQTKLQEESTAKAALVSEKTTLETERNQLSKKIGRASCRERV